MIHHKLNMKKFFFSVWIRVCLLKFSDRENDLSQTTQEKRFFAVEIFMINVLL